MSTESKIVKIFISSPNEVANERVIIKDIISDINGVWEDCLGIKFKAINWEKIPPKFVEKSVQTTINNDLNDCDIYLGILWKYFGTPVGKYMSGTEAEYEFAKKKKKNFLDGKNEGDIDIMFYFSNISYPPQDINTIQLDLVNDFKEKIRNNIIYSEYNSIEEFKYLIFQHLSIQLKERYEKIKQEKDKLEE